MPKAKPIAVTMGSSPLVQRQHLALSHGPEDSPLDEQRPGTFNEGADLRRARNKQQVEAIVARAQWLAPSDAALVRATFGQGASVAQVARIARADPRSLRRRLRRLVRRLGSREFLVVLRRWEEWTPTRRRVARACFIDGMSQRQACKDLKLSLHTVRRHSSAVKALAEVDSFKRAS